MPFSLSAHVYDLLYQRVRDYEGQAEQICNWIHDLQPTARCVLDVACGTGLHLSRLATWFDVAGIDVSPAMVRIANSHNPGALITVGDMRNFDLGRRFDAIICLFSSITYADSVEGLRETLYNFARHLTPGGVVIVEPYIPPESWQDGLLGLRTAEGQDLKVAMVDRAVRKGRKVRREIAYVITTPCGLQQICEEHQFYLFNRTEYENSFHQAGFTVQFDEVGFVSGRGMYFGKLDDEITEAR